MPSRPKSATGGLTVSVAEAYERICEAKARDGAATRVERSSACLDNMVGCGRWSWIEGRQDFNGRAWTGCQDLGSENGNLRIESVLGKRPGNVTSNKIHRSLLARPPGSCPFTKKYILNEAGKLTTITYKVCCSSRPALRSNWTISESELNNEDRYLANYWVSASHQRAFIRLVVHSLHSTKGGQQCPSPSIAFRFSCIFCQPPLHSSYKLLRHSVWPREVLRISRQSCPEDYAESFNVNHPC